MGREPLAAARWIGCCPRVSTARAFALYGGERSLRAAERRDLEAQKWRGVCHMGMLLVHQLPNQARGDREGWITCPPLATIQS